MTENVVSEVVAGRLKQARTALDDAEFLLEGNRSPKSVLNRAYYATFYAALTALQCRLKNLDTLFYGGQTESQRRDTNA